MIMTFEQFKYYLDAYGASLHRWPADVRAQAAAFLASSPAAAIAVAETRRLDVALDQFVVSHEADAERRLVDAVTARAVASPRGRRSFDLLFGFSSFWPRAAVLAAVAVLGVMTGIFQVENQAYNPAPVDVAQSLTSDSTYDVAGL